MRRFIGCRFPDRERSRAARRRRATRVRARRATRCSRHESTRVPASRGAVGTGDLRCARRGLRHRRAGACTGRPARRGARARRARRTPARRRSALRPRYRRSCRRREEQRVREEVVDPAAVPADHDRVRAAAVARGEQRELEVGGVLGLGVALDRRAGGDRGVEHGRVDRVEIADDDVDREAERKRVVEARSRPRPRGRRPGGPSAPSAGGGSPPANTSATLPISPSAGITRFRFEGSATHGGRPLSPAVPSSPGIRLSRPSYAFGALCEGAALHGGRGGRNGGRARDRARATRRDRVEQLGPAHVVQRHPAHRSRARAGSRARAAAAGPAVRAGAHEPARASDGHVRVRGLRRPRRDDATTSPNGTTATTRAARSTEIRNEVPDWTIFTHGAPGGETAQRSRRTRRPGARACRRRGR